MHHVLSKIEPFRNVARYIVFYDLRLVDEGFSIPDSEEVAMLHNADEEVCRKHLKSFQQLAEIGFPSKDVHQALIASSFDHQKALEQLIG